MRGIRSSRWWVVAVVGVALAVLGTGSVYGTMSASEEGTIEANAVIETAATTQQERSGASSAQRGSCETSALHLARSFIGRFAAQEWWATGLTPGTFVGIQLVDPTGRTTSMGSAPVDMLCEASGILPIGDRFPGAYTLIVSGTRPTGEAVDLVAPFNIVAIIHVPTATPMPTPPPPPRPPGGVRATAIDPNTVRVIWTDNADNEAGFRIDGEAGQFRVGPDTTSFNAGGLTPGTIYCFSVYAFNASGESYGGTSCAATPPRSGP